MSPDSPLPSLAIVVPCYNETAVLRHTATHLLSRIRDLAKQGLIADSSCLCLVDDGSSDDTWSMIRELSDGHVECCGLRLARNFGHQNALLAGLLQTPGDVLVSMDADLQDDPAILEEMLQAYAQGADVVFAARARRSSDTWLKRTSAEAFYKLLRSFGVNLVPDHADFRLMSRRAVEALRSYREVNLFLRGLVPQLGHRQAVVYYDRQPRHSGESKYTLRKMAGLAINGITSFSAVPLRMIALTGVIVFLGSLLISAWALGVRLFTDDVVPGWASSVLPMYLLGGIQLLSIAVVGEYVSKIYLETKGRPRFLIEEAVGLARSAAELPPSRTSEIW